MNNLSSGLYLVSTPIGNARDITLRALDVLGDAQELIAEDTRTLKKLLNIHGISRSAETISSYHDFSKPKRIEEILTSLAKGRSVALVSEAGTPLISDPGFKLVKNALARGIAVIPIPGPSAPISALTVAGQDPDRFIYLGFLPQVSGARRKVLEEFRYVQATIILFESPNRLAKSLEDMQSVLGRDREASICRELTKKFEEVRRGTLGELQVHYAKEKARGEIVIVIERDRSSPAEIDMDEILQDALRNKSLRDAVAEVSGMLNISRKEIYRLALKLSANK